MSKLSLFVVLGILFSQTLFASETASVKVRSYLCNDQTRLRIGSGIFVEHEGRPFVVTSSEISFTQEDEKVCYEIFQGENRARATLKTKDFGMGMSLLEPLSSLSGQSTAPLTPTTVKGGEIVQITGAEHGTTTLQTKKGRLLTLKSDRHSLPFIDHLAEVIDVEVDAGFVGAPVWNKKGEWIGIVSSEYLKLTPGKPTYPFPWKNVSGFKQKHLLVIPTNVIAQWLEKIARGEKPRIETKLTDELEDKEVGYTGGIRLECLNPPAKAEDPKAGSFPIGGADGAGIGGGETSALSSKILVQPTSHGPISFAISEHEEWAKRLTQSLEKAADAELPFLFFRNESGGLDYRTFRSLRGYFRNLKRTSGAKSIVLSSHFETLNPQLAPHGREFALGAVDFLLHGSVMTENISTLLRRQYLVATIARSEYWKSLQRTEVDEVTNQDGPHSFAWAIMTQFGAKKLTSLANDFRQAADKVIP
jgi:hypothetical protein